MNIENEQTTARVSRLFEQIRRYFTLQKEYLSLNGVEMLTRLFTAIVLAVILILAGFLVILFGCFALAYWIGTLLDSTVLGFAIIAGVMLLVALLVWANRMSWIVQPTTRFMIGLFATKVVTPTLEGVMTVKENTSQQIEAQEQKELHDKRGGREYPAEKGQDPAPESGKGKDPLSPGNPGRSYPEVGDSLHGKLGKVLCIPVV